MRPLRTLAAAGTMLALITLAHGQNDVNKARIEKTCRAYAVEDKVSPDEMEAYIQQCVQDLLEIRSQEDTLPEQGDVPQPPPE